MSASAGDLYAAAEELLAAAALSLQDAPGGTISYQAVWPGMPAYDCAPALFVHAGGPRYGDTIPLSPPLQPYQRQVTTGVVNLIELTITVLRCVPTLEQAGQTIALPSPAAVSAAAEQTMGDVWAIWNGLKNQHRAGTLFQRPSGRREFGFNPAVAVRTSGGVGGWEIPCVLELGGYGAGS